MADSVDRVFGHALRVISRLRNSSSRPPIADRLKLYGLYKQSMEGDVAALFPRPTGSSDAARKEAEKWDAWDSRRGLTRTEAKRAYIDALIETMRQYACETEEQKELVGELEFVWDQVKSAAGSGSGSGSEGELRTMGPESEPAEHDEEDDDDGEGEEWVDAPISQIGEAQDDDQVRRGNLSDTKWRKRMEQALVRTTTELAALRELLESKRYIAQQRRKSLLGWLLSASWFAFKLILADALLLWIALIYLRRRKDRRLEGAIRVMLGDAQIVAKKVATQVQSKLPKR